MLTKTVLRTGRLLHDRDCSGGLAKLGIAALMTFSLSTWGCIVGDNVIVIKGTIASPHDVNRSCTLSLHKKSGEHIVEAKTLEANEFVEGFIVAPKRRTYFARIRCAGYEAVDSEAVETVEGKTEIDLGAIHLRADGAPPN